jgi:hypothetical protein
MFYLFFIEPIFGQAEQTAPTVGGSRARGDNENAEE